VKTWTRPTAPRKRVPRRGDRVKLLPLTRDRGLCAESHAGQRDEQRTDAVLSFGECRWNCRSGGGTMRMAVRNTTWRIGASILRWLLCAMLVASCSSDVVDLIDPSDEAAVVTIVAPQEIRVTDGLLPVPDTIVLERRSANGAPAPDKVDASGTTGFLRQLPSGGWARPGVMTPDSMGRLRLLWLPSGSGPQRLTFTSFGSAKVDRTFSLTRSGVPVRADSVVPSGKEAICFQQGGRIGCVGAGNCGDCGDGGTLPSLAFDAVHWFRLRAPPRMLTSTLSGACALMIDGNTSCWTGLGPDSVARNDVGHPPFVEFTGSIGRTADGAVWKGVISGSTGFAQLFQFRTWNLIPSDSTITSLLTDFEETFVCARTASRAVMCSVADRGILEPSVIMQPFRLLRSLPDSSVVRAVSGYTAVVYEREPVVASTVVRTGDGTGLRFVGPMSAATGWYATPARDSTLSGDDVHTRSCVAVLDARCDGTTPWHQVSIAGRMRSPGSSSSLSGFRRTCGVRDVIVCHLLITSAPGQGSFGQRFELVDTIRIAP
jgi:hypothetical protein